MRRQTKQSNSQRPSASANVNSISEAYEAPSNAHAVDGTAAQNGPADDTSFDTTDGKSAVDGQESLGQALSDCGKRFLLTFVDRFSFMSATTGLSVYPLIALLTPLTVRGSVSMYKNTASVWWTRVTVLVLWFTTIVFSRSPRLAAQFSSPIAMEVIITMGRFMIFAEEVVGWSAYSLLAEEETERGAVPTAVLGGGGGVGGDGFGPVLGSSAYGSSSGVGSGSRLGAMNSRRPGPPRSLLGNVGGGNGPQGLAANNNYASTRSRPTARFYSYCTASAFFVEQMVWFVALLLVADISVLNSLGMGLYFASCLWWCNFPVLVNAALMFCFLNAYLCSWIYPPAVRAVMNGTNMTFGGSHFLARAYASYGCSLLMTTLLTEGNVAADSRARLVELIVCLPQRLLRVSRNARSVVTAVAIYAKVLDAFYFVDFFSCMSFALYVSMLLLSDRTRVTLGAALFAVLILPSLVGNMEEWQLEPTLAFADALACVSVFLTITIILIASVPLAAMPFLAKSMMGALLVGYAASHSTHARRRPWAYMLFFIVLLVITFCSSETAPTLPPMVINVRRGGRLMMIERVESVEDFWDVVKADITYVFTLPLSLIFHWAIVAATLQYLLVSCAHCFFVNANERRRRKAEAAAAAAKAAAEAPVTAATATTTTATTAGERTSVSNASKVKANTHRQKDPKPIKATSKKGTGSGSNAAANATTATTSASGGSFDRNGTTSSAVPNTSLPRSTSSSSSVDTTLTNSGIDKSQTNLAAEEEDATDTKPGDAERIAGSANRTPSAESHQTDDEAGLVDLNPVADKNLDDASGTPPSHSSATGDDDGAQSATVPEDVVVLVEKSKSGVSVQAAVNESECTLSDSQVSQPEAAAKSQALPQALATSDDVETTGKGRKSGNVSRQQSLRAQDATPADPKHSPTESKRKSPATPLPTKKSSPTPAGAKDRKKEPEKEKEKPTGNPKAEVTTAGNEPAPSSTAETRPASIPLPRSSQPSDAATRATTAASATTAPDKSDAKKPSPTAAAAATQPAATTVAAPFAVPKPRHEQPIPQKPAVVTKASAEPKAAVATKVAVEPKSAAGSKATPVPKVSNKTTNDAAAKRPTPADNSNDAQKPSTAAATAAVAAVADRTSTEVDATAVPLPRSQRLGSAPPTGNAEVAAPATPMTTATVANEVPPPSADEASRGNYFLSFLQPVLDSQGTVGSLPKEPVPHSVAATITTTPSVPAVAATNINARPNSSPPPHVPTADSEGVTSYEGAETSGITLDIGRLLQWIDEEEADSVTPRANSAVPPRHFGEDESAGMAGLDGDTRAIFEFLNQNDDTVPRAGIAAAVAPGDNAAVAPASAHTWSIMPREGAAATMPLPQNMTIFSTSAPAVGARGEDNGGGVTTTPKEGRTTDAHWTVQPVTSAAEDGTKPHTADYLSAAFSTVPRRAATAVGATATGAPAQNGPKDGDVAAMTSLPTAPTPLTPDLRAPQRANSLSTPNNDMVEQHDSQASSQHLPPPQIIASPPPGPAMFAPQFATPASVPGMGGLYYPSVVHQVAQPTAPGTPPQTPQVAPQVVQANVVSAVPGNQMALVRVPDGRLSLCPIVFVNGRSFVAAPPGSTIVAEAPQQLVYGMAGQAQPTGFPVGVPFLQQFQRPQ